MRNAIIILIVLAGCIQPSLEKNVNNGYFDFQGFMESQLKLVQSSAAGLNKWAIIGKDTAQNYLSPDTAAWRNELGILLDIDLNEPRLQGMFNISDSTDASSNLKIKVFRSVDTEEIEIGALLVYYLNDMDQPYRTIIELGNVNPIFRDEKRIEVWFEHIGSEPRLDSVYMEGFQKRLLSDTVTFELASKVKY